MLERLIRHATFGNLMMAAFLVLGIFGLSNIKRESMPDFTIETLQISGAYPGATAEEIEEAIGAPIEEALEGVNDIKSITTTSMEGSISVRVEMLEKGDWQTFYNEVKTEVEGIGTFPGEFENLIIKPYNRTDEVFSLAVTGDMSPLHLKEYCERLKEKLTAAAAGIKVDISGFSQREFRIELHPAALRAYNLSVVDIASIIKEQNTDLPSGTLQSGQQDSKLRFSDRRKTVADLAGIRVLHSASGNELLLGDIATITDRFKQDEQRILFNGRRAGIISVSKSKSADSLTIFDRAMRVMEREMAAAPAGVDFAVTRNRASDIRDRLDMLYLNAIEGFVLVFLALWLFLNLKLSFWVAMGLPVSFLGGIFVMNWLGVSLNMMSTFSLLIALGLLMDDAIVIAENVAAHLMAGENPIDAAVKGVREVGRGVLSSFVTTICIFAPLLFISGIFGKILYVIPATLIIVLTVSMFEAFFILPGHLAHSFPKGYPAPGRARRRINAWMDHVRNDLVGGLVRRLMPWRYALLTGVAMLFLFSVALFPAGWLKVQIFPSVDSDTAVARVQLPPGTPLAASETAARQVYQAAVRVNDRLRDHQPGGRDLVTSVSVYFSTNSDVQDSGPHLFTVYADLLKGDERASTMAEVVSAWREETGVIPGAMTVRFEDMMSGPGGKPVEIRLSGPNLDILKAASEDLQARLSRYNGVFDVSDDLTPGKPEVVMSMKPGAMKLGLSATDVARQLRAAYQGEKADELQIGRENYEFNVRLRDNPDSNLEDFDNFHLLAGGVPIPLASVADIGYQRSPSVIKRYNRQRTVTVSADIDPARANAVEVTGNVRRAFAADLARNFPGVEMAFGGQREAGGETGGSILWAFFIGILGVFILLSLQFESYLEPVAIMVTIPLAAIGAIWGHVIFGMDFNIQSLIGLVSIAGIVVNDSIIMIEFIKLRESQGASAREAAEGAASDRFRAVMLTSMTTIVGLLPLLMEKSLQAQMLIPVAISIVFGITASTLLVLFVTPAFYAVILDYREWRQRRVAMDQ